MKWEEVTQKLSYKSKVIFRKHGSTILTTASAVGLVATAVSAVRVTPKVMSLLEAQEAEKEAELTTVEKIQIAGPHYIPTMLIGAGSIVCMFGANALNKKQQASITSAYALLDNSFKQYKLKVEELYGEGTNTRVIGEIAKDKYEEEDIEFENDEQLFYDDFSGRYFNATMLEVVSAEYDMNRQLSMHSGAYLNDFYRLLGLEEEDYGDFLGWSQALMYDMYWDNWLEFVHEKVVMDDGLECTIIRFGYEPTPDFEDY